MGPCSLVLFTRQRDALEDPHLPLVGGRIYWFSIYLVLAYSSYVHTKTEHMIFWEEISRCNWNNCIGKGCIEST